MAGDHSLALAAALDRIEVLEARVNRVYPLDVSCAEHERVERWWVTYNAALTKLATMRGADVDDELDALHEACVVYADRAHGPLTLETPP